MLYICKNVVRIQYMASDETGRKVKAMTALVNHLIQKYSGKYTLLDMGGSNEPGSGELNSGLLLFKSGLGGRGMAFSTYSINL